MYKKIPNVGVPAKNNSLKRSMMLSTLCKPLGMIISFLYTPLLLGYLGDETYGIWSTILSVINWINYFDVGIGQGLRNTLAKYIADKNEIDANKAVSTGYVVLSIISTVTFTLGTIVIVFADVGMLFNTKVNVRPALLVSFFCICLNFVLGLSRAQLYATQQAEKVGFMTIMIQGLNLIGVWILSKVSHGSLFGVAFIIGFSGTIVNILFTQGVWNVFPFLIPHYPNYEKKMLKEVCSIGVKFFFIQIAALVLYSTDNMIITQLFGPTYVTPYHTSYMAFGIVNGLFASLLSPLWSEYTIAMHEKNYHWINKTVLELDKTLPVIAVVLIIGVIVFEPVSAIWLNKDIKYEYGLVPCMAIYFFLQVWGSIYSTVLNGIGKVNLQLVLGVLTALINIPLSIFLGKYCGMRTTGVLLATIICMLITDLPVTIHTHKYLYELSKPNH